MIKGELNQADEKVTRVISARRASRQEKNMKSKKIDFSDIPQLSDKQLSRMRQSLRANEYAGPDPQR
jgi:hypothetical protein